MSTPAKVLVAAIVAFLLVSVAVVQRARAESVADWYKSLRQPISGISCCDESDCRPTRARMSDGGWWQAQTPSGQWVDVPAARVIMDKGHPSGAAVLCSAPSGHVYCFVPPGAGG